MQITRNGLFSHQIYFIIFSVSGLSGLIYESIWTHYLKLFLGHAAYAQTLVLIIFMGGMALGAWATSRFSHRIGNLLLGYAVVEGLIGLLALVFHPVFIQSTSFAYDSVIPSLDSVTAIKLVKWSLATSLILPQSILLGSTFPLMSAGVIRIHPKKPGRTLAVLYFANSLGASVGALVSGFYLIEAVGLPGTIVTAGLINIVLAVFVWFLCRGGGDLRDPVLDPESKRSFNAPSGKLLAGFMLCACFTGAASFMYEIGWIRMLNLVLSSSTHAFELMLSAFILGLAIGGFWIKGRIDSLPDQIGALGIIQLVMGALALATLPLYGLTFDVMSFALTALTKTEQGYWLFNLLSHGLAMAIMLPATICAGMTLPLLTCYLVSNGYGEGSIGRIYAANTLGAIIGVVVGTQLIMPLLGVKNLITAGAGLDIALGLVLLWYAASWADRKRWGLAAAASAAVLIFSVLWVDLDPIKMSSGVYRSGVIPMFGREVIFHRDGKTASIYLVKDKNQALSISTNGKPDAAIGINRLVGDEPTMVLMAALPWAVHPSAKTVAVIGMGSGLTSHVLLTIPSIERVDTIEIEPAMVEGARGFGDRVANTFTDPRSKIHIEDAKTYFSNHKEKYDLIISEPSNPWVSGVAGLFSTEFYSLIRGYLNEDGLLAQWLNLYEIDISLVASVIKAVSANFASYSIYAITDSDILIIAGKQGGIGEPSEKVFEIPALRKELAHVGVTRRHDMLLRWLGGKKSLDPFFNSYAIPANSDFFPVLDLGAARTRFLDVNARALHELRTVAAPLLEALEGRPLPVAPLTVGANHFFTTGQRARQASAIHLYFQRVTGRNTRMPAPMAMDMMSIVRNIRSIHGQCAHDEMKSVWFNNLGALAKATLPYLSPKEMEVIWRDIESAHCFSGLPDDIRNWVSLFKAVGERNHEEVLRLAGALLPDKTIEASTKNNYLLEVSMLAHIVLKHEEAAIDLWKRYRSRSEPPLTLRMLYITARQR